MNKIILIAGLGNPGPKYRATRHNAGFIAVDRLAKELNAAFKIDKKRLSQIAEGGIERQKIVIAKPQTFMNESGRAVEKLLARFRISPNKLIVIHDEIDLPFGKIRFSQGSGAAGHKGILSIMAKIGKDFLRIRLGIESRQNRLQIPTEDFVLQNFSAKELKTLNREIFAEVLEEIKRRFLQ